MLGRNSKLILLGVFTILMWSDFGMRIPEGVETRVRVWFFRSTRKRGVGQNHQITECQAKIGALRCARCGDVVGARLFWL